MLHSSWWDWCGLLEPAIHLLLRPLSGQSLLAFPPSSYRKATKSKMQDPPPPDRRNGRRLQDRSSVSCKLSARLCVQGQEGLARSHALPGQFFSI